MKKLILSTLLAGLFLVPTANVSAQNEKKETAHWSLGIKGGLDYYRVQPNLLDDHVGNAGWDGGLLLEYSINPLWGFGFGADYLSYNRSEKYKGSTIDATLYGSVNLMNLLSPNRKGGWQKISLYANLGFGAGFYSYDIEGGAKKDLGDKVSPLALAGLNFEVALGKRMAIFAEGQYRYYVMRDLGGASTTFKDYNDAAVANLGLRFKFNAGKKDHVRNMLPNTMDSKELDVIKAELQQLKNQANKTNEDVNKINKNIDDNKKKQDQVNKDTQNDIDNLRKALKDLESQQSANAVMHNIEFKFDSADLTPASFTALDNIAATLKDNSTWQKLVIAGHTDNIGTKEVNKRVSEARAKNVKDYLVKKGISASKIETVGHGAEKPIASNNTSAGRQQNRRVEFQLSK